jgi:hypothetical protein
MTEPKADALRSRWTMIPKIGFKYGFEGDDKVILEVHGQQTVATRVK